MVSSPYVVTAALHGAVNGLPRFGARRSITVDQQAQQSRRGHCRNWTAIVAAGTAVLSLSRKKRCSVRRCAGPVSWQELVRQSDAPEKTEYCASWGCSCAGGRKPYPYQQEKDYFQSHPAAKKLAEWCETLSLPSPTMWNGEPMGYRTRGKMAVGPGPRKVIIGLFKRGTWKVLPVAGCVVNHPRLRMAMDVVQQVLSQMDIPTFDHDGSAHATANEGTIRYLEFTLERNSGLVQLVIVWNGSGEVSPQLAAVLEELWSADATSHHFWHSIWVHWRDLDPSLLRAIHSKQADAWQQVRPCDAKDPGHVIECLDGLHFSFGPASFQQTNLPVFEKILQDMKMKLLRMLGDIVTPERSDLRIMELCSGVGVIGLSLAHATEGSKELKQVTLLSTDVNPNCESLFAENAKRIFPKESICEVKFSTSSAAEALAALGPNAADVLVIDPPRRGLADRSFRRGLVGGEDQTAAICNSGVKAVIYMSCGYNSFMADAERLMSGTSAGAFELKSLSCYDMFPYTPHLECLGIFQRLEHPNSLGTPSVGTSKTQADPGQKLQCQFIIGIEQDRVFNVKQRLLGERGHHMKLIAQRTDCKLRLRGRGSNFKEGPARRESTDPLMLCISSKNQKKHQEAVMLVQGLVEDVYKQYRSFLQASGKDAPELQVRIHEGPRPGSRR